MKPTKFVPKLFCQVGDKKNDWHWKTVERYATLLLTIQGAKFNISDKTSPKLHNLLPVHEEIKEGEPGKVGGRAVVAQNELVQLNQVELNCEDIPVVTAEYVNLENIPVAAASENLEEEIEGGENGHPKEVENIPEVAMGIDVVVDEMGENAEMETSLNFNISSVSDTPEEGLNHDGEKKKKFNLFVKAGKDNVVQAIKPGLDNEKSKRGSAKKQQSLPKKQVKEKKTPQNKKGQKKDNETISPVKSKKN